MGKVELKKAALSNGEEIAYREREGGEHPLLLVHGNMTSSVHWDLVLENLAEEYKVYAIDLRGFGESSYHHPITEIKDFSNDVKLFIDALGLNCFAMAGWSLGGTVCQQFCADYPGYCTKLFLLASGSSRGYAYYPLGEDGTLELDNRMETLAEMFEDSKRKMVQTAYDTHNYDFLRQMWNMAIYTQGQPEEERYQKYLKDMTTQRNLAECYHALNIFNISHQHNGLTEGNGLIDRIDIPVMIAWGEHDLVVTKQMTEELREDYDERAEYRELKGCGHSPLVDDLDQLLAVMEEFFTREKTSKGAL